VQSLCFFFSPRPQTTAPGTYIRAYLPVRGLLSTTLGSAYRSACLGVVGSKMFCCSLKLPKSNITNSSPYITPRNKPSQKVNIIFQPLIVRVYLLVSGMIQRKNYHEIAWLMWLKSRGLKNNTNQQHQQSQLSPEPSALRNSLVAKLLVIRN